MKKMGGSKFVIYRHKRFGTPAAMFNAYRKAGTESMRKALNEHAKIVLHSARLIVPFLYGDLSASGRVSQKKEHQQGYSAAVVFGSNSVLYALVQHEDLSFKHAPGRMAKYLEIAMRPEISGDLAKRLANELRWQARKRLG
jgi:hypothetical protein